jgi:hypothetical protein
VNAAEPHPKPTDQASSRGRRAASRTRSDPIPTETGLALAGSRAGHAACRALKAGHRRPKHSHACTVAKTIGSFTHQDTAGPNRLPFSGKLHGHALAAGTYSLQVTPTHAGLTGKTITAPFRIS